MFLKCAYGNMNDLYNIFEKLHPKIKFTIEHRFKELPFLDILT